MTPAGGASAVPAGGGQSLPFSGGSGKTPGRHHDRSARSSLDWDRKERVTPVERRTVFRTIGTVRPDRVPGSALELSGGVGSLPQAPRERAPSMPFRTRRGKEDQARGRIRRCGQKSAGVPPS